MISRTDGDAKLMPLMDSANCSPTVTVDRPYVLGVSYKSTALTFFALYRQDANGVWSYWTQSPRFAASDTYVAVTWRSPPVPAGTVAVSFGLALDSVRSRPTNIAWSQRRPSDAAGPVSNWRRRRGQETDLGQLHRPTALEPAVCSTSSDCGNRLTVEYGDRGRYTFLPWMQTRPS
jgi:hypothetical protein